MLLLFLQRLFLFLLFKEIPRDFIGHLNPVVLTGNTSIALSNVFHPLEFRDTEITSGCTDSSL